MDLEVVVGRKYVGLTTSWHGLVCHDPDDMITLHGTEGVGVLQYSSMIDHEVYTAQ